MKKLIMASLCGLMACGAPIVEKNDQSQITAYFYCDYVVNGPIDSPVETEIITEDNETATLSEVVDLGDGTADFCYLDSRSTDDDLVSPTFDGGTISL